MNRILKTVILSTAIMILLSAPLMAGEKTWTFDAKEKVSIKTVSSDCMVVAGDNDKIEISVDAAYDPEGSFEPIVRERKRYIDISEQMYHSNRGYATWRIRVPKNTEINFSTASGDLLCRGLEKEVFVETASGSVEFENCSGELEANTASGRIELTECTGMFDMNSASGAIGFNDCKGEFRANTASGKIDADDAVISEYSEFSTASGRVNVTLAETCQHDLILSSASGRVTLDYNGNRLEGTFELTSKVRGGRVSAPFDFDDEKSFRRWGDEYSTKTAYRGTQPLIVLKTATGKADLREN